MESIYPSSANSDDDYTKKVSTRSLDSINGGYFVKRSMPSFDDDSIKKRSLDSINGGYFVKKSIPSSEDDAVIKRSLDSINGGYFVKRFTL